MNIVAPVRFFLARRPWVYWTMVAALATLVGLGVRSQLDRADEARRSWDHTQSVWVAENDIAPGEAIRATRREYPSLAVPAGAVHVVPPETMARQHIGVGETITRHDVVVGDGPAGLADDHQVVVAVSDPLLTVAPVGVAVSIYADGQTIARDARIVHVGDGVLYIAVDESDGPIVAAAAQLRSASVVFTRR